MADAPPNSAMTRGSSLIDVLASLVPSRCIMELSSAALLSLGEAIVVLNQATARVLKIGFSQGVCGVAQLPGRSSCYRLIGSAEATHLHDTASLPYHRGLLQNSEYRVVGGHGGGSRWLGVLKVDCESARAYNLTSCLRTLNIPPVRVRLGGRTLVVTGNSAAGVQPSTPLLQKGQTRPLQVGLGVRRSWANRRLANFLALA